MGSKALIIYGGWEGHSPEETSLYMSDLLATEGYQVLRVNDLSILNDLTALREFDLIIMHWTRGDLEVSQYTNIQQVVSEGTGLAGIHGGLTSAFQNNKKWLWLTGGCFVSHPGGLGQEYKVNITDTNHVITSNISDFSVKTEQYYVLVDPAVHILATSSFEIENHPNYVNCPIKIPISWTKYWGKGKVFFQSIGHDLEVLKLKSVSDLTIQGFKWASRTENR